MNIFQIPLISSQQTFSITLNGTIYTMRLIYCDDPAAGWLLDIGDSGGAPLLCGIPLKAGANLLEQYNYLDFGGGLMVVLSGNITSIGYTDLGVNAQLYFVVPTTAPVATFVPSTGNVGVSVWTDAAKLGGTGASATTSS